MRRWLFVALLCLPGISLVGQDRVSPAPRLTDTTRAINNPPRNASPISGPAATIVTSKTAFPSLSPANNPPPDAATASSSSRLAGPTVTVASSLAVVLGLFAALVWITRKFGSRSLGNATLPRDVIQSLGSIAIDPRTRVTMLRCGHRILVVAQTQTGIQPLSEITDPEEVRQLAAACSADSKQSFSSTIRSLENEPIEPGFIGGASDARPPRRRLFATA